MFKSKIYFKKMHKINNFKRNRLRIFDRLNSNTKRFDRTNRKNDNQKNSNNDHRNEIVSLLMKKNNKCDRVFS